MENRLRGRAATGYNLPGTTWQPPDRGGATAPAPRRRHYGERRIDAMIGRTPALDSSRDAHRA
jgi:hypothetical protein